MNSWNDFNSAEEQNDFDLIPKGTLVKVRMTIRPGGYDDPSHGWTSGYATRNDTTGSVYLNCEFVITEGKYARRKVWSLIGLYSPKGPDWANIGRSFIKGILNSARGLHPKDNSDQALSARRIQGFAELDGVEFLARMDVGKDQNGQAKNEIRIAVTPDHKEYAAHMGTAAQSAPAQASATPSQPANPNRPSWAQ